MLPRNETVPALFVFGDSIVDPGNNNGIRTIAKCNFPPYGRDFKGGQPTGRFSNGTVPSDIMVKHDCVFGDDLDIAEISFMSEVLKELDRPILYSLSPGSSVTPAMAKDVSGLVNMCRITGDDWDTWGDVASHFNISRDFSSANIIGVKGLNGKSWPDLDMLPLGWLTDPVVGDER